MKNFIKKLTSRKFWFALAGIATGIAMSVGVNTTEITTLGGGIVAVISCVTYIVVEGKIDAEAVKNAIVGVQDAVDTIVGGDDV